MVTQIDRALPAVGRHVVFPGNPSSRIVGSCLEEGRRARARLIHHERGEARRRHGACRQQTVTMPHAGRRGVDDRAVHAARILPREGNQTPARRPREMHAPALRQRVLGSMPPRIVGIALDQPHAGLPGRPRTRDDARAQTPQSVAPQRLRFLRMLHDDRLQTAPGDARLERLARRRGAQGDDAAVAISAPLPASGSAKRALAQQPVGAVRQPLPCEAPGSPSGHEAGGIKLKPQAWPSPRRHP